MKLSSSKGKGKADSKATSKSAVGAPSQYKQSSRKGKKAWRKHVDIDDVETKLEGMREEERITGGRLHQKSNAELFTIDVVGDEKLKRTLRTQRPLKSLAILKARSAVPAVFSRPTTSVKPKSASLTRQEKSRLLRIGRRKQLGPFNSIVDHTEVGAGSAILEPSEAVKKSGTYDVWIDIDEDEKELASRLKTAEAKDFIEGVVKKQRVKPPTTSDPRKLIEVSAVAQPHEGTSYNPPVSSHQELLQAANEVEEKREAEIEKYAGVKQVMEAARYAVREGENNHAAPGMQLDLPGEDADGDANPDEDEEEAVAVANPSLPARKTKQQRRKAARVLDEKRALAERARKKKLTEALHPSNLVRMKKEVAAAKNADAKAAAERKLAEAEKLKAGLAGSRLGKHKVPTGDIDVQLGEELSESLRQLKTEGNLFRDRFVSLQNRALVEPRAPVLPKKRKTKVKEVEKYAWKRFE